MRSRLDKNRAMTDVSSPALRKTDTIYLCVVDRDRNAASFISSTYGYFGSMIIAPNSGVTLQNRGASFRLDPQHPNSIAPRKRPDEHNYALSGDARQPRLYAIRRHGR